MASVPKGSSLSPEATRPAPQPRARIKWAYLSPLVFLLLPLVNYGARSAGLSPKARLGLMFGAIGVGVVHGAVSISSAMQSSAKDVH